MGWDTAEGKGLNVTKEKLASAMWFSMTHRMDDEYVTLGVQKTEDQRASQLNFGSNCGQIWIRSSLITHSYSYAPKAYVAMHADLGALSKKQIICEAATTSS